MQLVRGRTTHILAVEQITARDLGARISSNQVKRLTAEAVDQMPLYENLALAIKASLAIINVASVQIDVLEKRLKETVKPRAEYAFLSGLPGVGRVLATTILLETGPIERFGAEDNFLSYARCVDCRYTSNGKRKAKGNTKKGNKYLAWAFIEAAHFGIRYCPQAKRFHKRKKAKTNNVVATKVLMHELARACFHMLKGRKPFDVTRCFS